MGRQSTQVSENSALRHYRHAGARFDFFSPIMLLSLFFFGWSGWYMHTHNPPPISIPEQLSRMQQTQFIIDEPKPVPKIEKPRPVVEKKVEQPLPQEPIDLTKNPILNQPKDDIVDNPVPQQQQKPVRRVYGLKKVYSTGIGASGNASDAVIGKLGNTLDTDIDTITATESDLKSPPVSITTLTTPPRQKTVVKPEYTKEMLENKIEGVVRVKVLIDIDGKVKQAIVLDDLGFGTKEAVAKACFASLFVPGFVGDRPVSVWIQLKFRFEMLNG
jgi:hypothetical protein